MIIEMQRSQLEASNVTIRQLSSTIDNLQQTISDLRKTVANLESLLKERDNSLNGAKAQLRGIKSTFLPKQSEKQHLLPKPITTEESDALERERKEKIKARGNNGAKRKDHFTIETREEDVFPVEINTDEGTEIGVRDVIRYEMIRPSFIKHIYHVHTLKKGEEIFGTLPKIV